MDIVELGAIGELVGGLAVIGSLVYVGLQVRQGNRMERSQANREMTQQFMNVLNSIREPVLVDLVQRGAADWADLSLSDQAFVDSWIGGLHLNALSAYLAGRQGLMDEDYANGWTDFYVSYLKCPGFRQWWDYTRPTHHPDFIEHVEGRLLASDGPPAVHTTRPWYVGDA